MSLIFIFIQIIHGDQATIPISVIRHRNVASAACFTAFMGGALFVLIYYSTSKNKPLRKLTLTSPHLLPSNQWLESNGIGVTITSAPYICRRGRNCMWCRRQLVGALRTVYRRRVSYFHGWCRSAHALQRHATKLASIRVHDCRWVWIRTVTSERVHCSSSRPSNRNSTRWQCYCHV
jgi:hypothetical protein